MFVLFMPGLLSAQTRNDRALLESLLSRPGKYGQQRFRFFEGTRNNRFTYEFFAGGRSYRYTTHLGNIQAIDYIEVLQDAERRERQDKGYSYWDNGRTAIALTLKRPVLIQPLEAYSKVEAQEMDALLVVPLYIPGYRTCELLEHILVRLDPATHKIITQYEEYTPDTIQTHYLPLYMYMGQGKQTKGRAAALTIARYPVTVAQYRFFCRQTKRSMPTPPPWGWRDDHPIVGVTQEDAVAYCVWLSQESGRDYRLPTETEWRIAAQTPVEKSESESISIDSIAWWGENANETTHPVGQKRPNRMGLYDMAGNVWEWTQTRQGHTEAIIKGGSWDSHFEQCTPAYRTSLPLLSTQDDVGFRVVMEPGRPDERDPQ